MRRTAKGAEPGLAYEIGIFLDWLKAGRAMADNTIEAYGGDLRRLESFLIAAELPVQLEHWKLETLRRFIVDQGENGHEPATIVRRLACLRCFCRFALREKLLEQDWSLKLESPKLWKKIPGILSHAEIMLLLDACRSSRFPLRDRAILEMLYGSGLRASELASLRVADLRKDDQLLKIRGKGGRERYGPLGEYARESLDEYLRRERPLLVARSQERRAELFISDRGLCMSRQGLYALCRRLGRLAGFEKVVHPHMFRHTYATHLLENGADLRIIQELLGHADVSTTERYTQVDLRGLRANFHQWHPRGK